MVVVLRTELLLEVEVGVLVVFMDVMVDVKVVVLVRFCEVVDVVLDMEVVEDGANASNTRSDPDEQSSCSSLCKAGIPWQS